MISTNLERLQTSNERIQSNIANAYAKISEKGVTLPVVQNSENLASAIADIPQSIENEEWKAKPDWFDIEKILEEDVEEYEGKVIALLTNTSNTYNINMYGASKVVTSDGAEYTTNATHTWDRTKDKECSLGYKTRYIIRYYANSNDFQYRNFNLTDLLYIIFQNLNINIPASNMNSNSPVYKASNCEYIKFIACTFEGSGANFSFSGCQKIKGIEGYAVQNDVNINTMYENFGNLTKPPYLPERPISMNYSFVNSLFDYIPYIDTSNVSSFDNAFAGCRASVIENLDFNSAVSVNNICVNMSWLVSINNVSNLKISGLKLNYSPLLNHDTLIRFLNALYDYSDDTENVHTIVLGSANLAKLTEGELAIAQNKRMDSQLERRINYEINKFKYSKTR